MLNSLKQKINELHNIIVSPIDNMFKTTALKNYKQELEILHKKSFGEVYYDFIKNNKENGTVYTPEPITLYMIENTLKAKQIIKNPYIKIVDPSCGTGNILICCFNYLKKLYKNNLYSINQNNGLKLNMNNIDEHIITNNLYGFDIDEIAIKILVIDLYGLSQGSVIRNILNEDFLLYENDKKYDICIGNPPYVGKKSIDNDYASYLKIRYKEVYKDKGDLSYCFFKKAIEELCPGGKLTFITSRYFLESPSGQYLRKVLKEGCSIKKIIDFYGVRPFKNIGIDPVIMFIENFQIEDSGIKNGEMDNNEIEIIKPSNIKNKNKNEFYNSIFLKNGKEFKSFFINKIQLDEKGWILIDEKKRNIINKIAQKKFTNLSNICDSYQGIITGCDKAFVVNSNIITRENIEKSTIKPWIKSSYIHKNSVSRQDSYIIYSDLILEPLDYPNAVGYIALKKEKLIKRRECQSGIRKWYELQWGRKQNIFEGEKIIFPFKASSNRFAIDIGSYFSADVYALILKDNSDFTYDFLLYLLNSKIYEFYFKTFAKKLGDDAYEYYPNNLMKLCIPEMMDIRNIDENCLFDYFDLTQEEKNIILAEI